MRGQLNRSQIYSCRSTRFLIIQTRFDNTTNKQCCSNLSLKWFEIWLEKLIQSAWMSSKQTNVHLESNLSILSYEIKRTTWNSLSVKVKPEWVIFTYSTSFSMLRCVWTSLSFRSIKKRSQKYGWVCLRLTKLDFMRRKGNWLYFPKPRI